MNKKQYKMLMVFAAGLVVIMAIWFNYLRNKDDTLYNVDDTLTNVEDKVYNINDSTETRTLTSSDIINILQKYDINNHEVSDSQIITEKLHLVYKDGNLISANTKTHLGSPYKYTVKNNGLMSIEAYTEYDKDITENEEYDTRTVIRYHGSLSDNNIVFDLLHKMYNSTSIVDSIIEMMAEEKNIALEVGDTYVELNTDPSGLGSKGKVYSILVYKNNKVHSDFGLDASKLVELEQLGNSSAFLENENWYVQNADKLKNVLDIEKIGDGEFNKKIHSINFERAYTREFDREKHKELNNFREYYIKKEIGLNNGCSLVVNIDGYDRYRCNRRNYVMIKGIVDKDVLENTKNDIFGNIEMTYRNDYETPGFKSLSVTEYKNK